MVNRTAVQFRNLSSGTYTTSSWTFGTEGRSNEPNPSYTFTREGVYGAALTVTGPLGSSSCSQLVTVHAMPPTCRNYTDGSSQSKVRIQNLRNAGLKFGQIVINNNYNNVSTKIELYHPDEWLGGRYSPYANLQWTINRSTTSGPLSGSSGGAAYNIGNDWGIKAIFSDGSESCIRSVHSVAIYQNNKFTVKVSDIYD
jgi:PKD repeat protein